MILPERRSASVTAAAWKVSAGAAAHMPVARVVNLTKAIESLKERGYYSVGLDGGGDALVGETGFETDPLVVVLGSEGNGLSRLVREACDSIAGIPMSNMVESLNAPWQRASRCMPWHAPVARPQQPSNRLLRYL